MPTNSTATPVEPADAFSKFAPHTTRWNPHNARAMVYASDLAYQKSTDAIKSTLTSWGFKPDRITVISPSTSVLQVIVAGSADAVIVAFRGTRPDQIADWMADVQLVQAPFTNYFAAPSVGSVHSGFAHLLATSWSDIHAEVMRFQDAGQTLWVTGHSLGGALAVLATAAFTFAARMPVNGLYTYGQPRVGDINFSTQCDSHFGDSMFRFVNDQDIVTRVPPRVVPHLPLPEFYGHSGQLRYFDGKGNLHDDGHWWNAFLINVDVGFAGMGKLLAGPVNDHRLIEGYAANIEKYIAGGCKPPMQ